MVLSVSGRNRRFIGTNATGAYDYFNLTTKEYSGTTYHPKLVLDYTAISIESASLGEIKAKGFNPAVFLYPVLKHGNSPT